MGTLSNAFTIAFKKLDPVPQVKATAWLSLSTASIVKIGLVQDHRYLERDPACSTINSSSLLGWVIRSVCNSLRSPFVDSDPRLVRVPVKHKQCPCWALPKTRGLKAPIHLQMLDIKKSGLQRP